MHFFMILLKPLRQPRFVSQLMASILVGPTFLGSIFYWERDPFRWMNLFPYEQSMLLESYANLGVTYYMFLVGLEMDLSNLKHTRKKSWSIAFAGFFIPFVVGAILYFVPLVNDRPERDQNYVGALFWAITLSITSFPDVARTLSDVKLLHTELGTIALSSALITDILTWLFLVLAIVISDENLHSITLSLVPIFCFITVSFFGLHPLITWMLQHTKNKQGKFSNKLSDTLIYIILMGVAVSGFITDACGSHSLVGGFVFGLIIPKGEFAIEVMEKTEEFVSGILLPGFLICSGIRTDFRNLVKETKWSSVGMITTIATSAKIVSTLVVSSSFRMSLKEGLTLGSLMNIKGVFALVVLNEGRNLKTLNEVYMVVMVFIILMMTCLVRPILMLINCTRKHSSHSKLRTIQASKPNSELRVLTCIHSGQNISGIIHLLEVSNSTRESPICVFAAHLVELTERASAILILHDKLKTSTTPSLSQGKSQPDHYIFSAFENYKIGNESVSLHPLSVLSPYTTMHEDISKVAEDKAVTIILIPFHKQPTADGGLQGENKTIKYVNKNLLAKAPCSVGILVDRGLGSSKLSKSLSSDKLPELQLAMLFIGGPDDHEALSYAWRMARKEGVILTVVRFRPSIDGKNNENESCYSIKEDENKVEFDDDDYINLFRFKSMYDKSITYLEKRVKSSNELEKAIGELYSNFDLYIVGRGRGVKSPLTDGLIDGGDSQELGVIGDTLISSKFTAHASVLVVQQSASSEIMDDSLPPSESNFKQKKWASPVLNPEYEAKYGKEQEERLLMGRICRHGLHEESIKM
ncbi:hypothetical protein Patl1_02000 [Pistacia atlantica]|uniref:Uncharacterized protein n=1 Tax=Pistacia atlantica TaxID=434234 RepID=A0ACC1CAQ6_9ROSI|nr:hypothetical protein Patl1_02000 [Pistacia atlantica]